MTFSRTLGGLETGVPSLAHTWFPGHVWSYCQCARCRLHLGWYHGGQQNFVGLAACSWGIARFGVGRKSALPAYVDAVAVGARER